MFQEVGVDLGSAGWEERLEEALESDEIVLNLISNPNFWWYTVWASSFEPDTETACAELTTRLDNPDVWSAATMNYAYALGRHLVVTCPDGKITDGAMDTWLRQNPFDVYAVGFAWQEHAKPSTRITGALKGPAAPCSWPTPPTRLS